MDPLDRIRRVASQALAALLVVYAAFWFAVGCLAVVQAAQGEGAFTNALVPFAVTLGLSGAAWASWRFSEI